MARFGLIDSRSRPYPILFHAHRPAVSGRPLPSSDQRPPALRKKTHASSRTPGPQPVRLAASLARLFFATGRSGVYVPQPIGDGPQGSAPPHPRRRALQSENEGTPPAEAPSPRGLLLATLHDCLPWLLRTSPPRPAPGSSKPSPPRAASPRPSPQLPAKPSRLPAFSAASRALPPVAWPVGVFFASPRKRGAIKRRVRPPVSGLRD